MSHSAAGPDARVIAEALLAHVEQKPVRAEVVEQLGSLEHAVGTDRLVSALHAAQLGEGAARAVGVRAATAGEVALAARFAGVGSIERALRQADRLLPREHTDGLFTVRALEPGEAKIVYRASTPVDPLLCAVRAGLLSGLPRCFGSSRARVEEVECAAEGNEACCYRVRWRVATVETSRLARLSLAAALGATFGLGVWAAGLWAPLASVALSAGFGLGAAAWWTAARSKASSDYRDELVAVLEQRIAERMDDLAKLDSRLELRRTSTRPRAVAVPGGAPRLDLGALQREAAAFGRRLESACQSASEASVRSGPASGAADDLEALAGHFAGLRDRVDGLVEESGQESSTDGSEDAGTLLECVVQRARRSRGAAPAISVEFESDLPLVRCSATRIEQALLRLLGHACESAGQEGQVEATAHAVAGGVEITVCGRGAPLDPERVEEVFDPFLGDGTEPSPGGEELRAAAQIVTEHGGALQLQPDAQSGTRASFVLPVAETA